MSIIKGKVGIAKYKALTLVPKGFSAMPTLQLEKQVNAHQLKKQSVEEMRQQKFHPGN